MARRCSEWVRPQLGQAASQPRLRFHAQAESGTRPHGVRIPRMRGIASAATGPRNPGKRLGSRTCSRQFRTTGRIATCPAALGATDTVGNRSRPCHSSRVYLHHCDSQGIPSLFPSIFVPGQFFRKNVASAQEVICEQCVRPSHLYDERLELSGLGSVVVGAFSDWIGAPTRRCLLRRS